MSDKIQVPSVSKVVHYVSYGSPGGEFPARECRASIITEVESETVVGIAVFNPLGIWFNRHVQLDEEKAAGTWHWPEFVPPIQQEPTGIQIAITQAGDVPKFVEIDNIRVPTIQVPQP